MCGSKVSIPLPQEGFGFAPHLSGNSNIVWYFLLKTFAFATHSALEFPLTFHEAELGGGGGGFLGLINKRMQTVNIKA